MTLHLPGILSVVRIAMQTVDLCLFSSYGPPNTVHNSTLAVHRTRSLALEVVENQDVEWVLTSQYILINTSLGKVKFKVRILVGKEANNPPLSATLRPYKPRSWAHWHHSIG